MADDGSQSFRALLLVNQERGAYGLRYNDYARYRGHCANKVHRLRASLKMTHGKGKEFKKLPEVPLQAVKNEHLQLLLFESERLYAFAQELYSGEKRHGAIAKYRRALLWADRLLNLCQQLPTARISPVSLCEVVVYRTILHGRFSLRRGDFVSALGALSASRHLLNVLRDHYPTSRDQALSDLFVDEISPEIRYCAHEMKRPRSHDVDRIVGDIAPQYCQSSIRNYTSLVAALHDQPTSVSVTGLSHGIKSWIWQGSIVSVRNPELVDVQLKVQDAEDKLGGALGKQNRKAIMMAYDTVLQAWSEAEEVSKKLLDSRQLRTSSHLEPGANDPQFIHSYIVFHLLARRTARDFHLVSALKSTSVSGSRANVPKVDNTRVHAAMIKILGSILQNLDQMRFLAVVDESPDLATHLDTCISFTKAERCHLMAGVYASDTALLFSQALALLQRGRLHLREAKSHQAIATDLLLPADLNVPGSTEISDLEDALDKDETRFKSQWFVFNGGSPTHSTTSNAEIIHKPLFFDIAVNYIDIDLDRLRRRAGQELSAAHSSSAAPAGRAKEDELSQPTPELPKNTSSRLGSLLGSWWR